MREAGEVVYADVYKDGTAVCEFKSYDDMKWALKNLDDTKFKSHEVCLLTLKSNLMLNTYSITLQDFV